MISNPYLLENNILFRLFREYVTHGSLVIAYDFDNTVFDYHNQGIEYSDTIELLQDLKSVGCTLICFTASEDIDHISKYLTDNDIPFDKINENPDFWKGTGRKIYFNALLDDRAGLNEMSRVLKDLILMIKELKNV